MSFIRISKKLSEKLTEMKILVNSRFYGSAKKISIKEILKWLSRNITAIMLLIAIIEIGFM